MQYLFFLRIGTQNDLEPLVIIPQKGNSFDIKLLHRTGVPNYVIFQTTLFFLSSSNLNISKNFWNRKVFKISKVVPLSEKNPFGLKVSLIGRETAI